MFCVFVSQIFKCRNRAQNISVTLTFFFLMLEIEKKFKLEDPIFQLFYHVLCKDGLHTLMTF